MSVSHRDRIQRRTPSRRPAARRSRASTQQTDSSLNHPALPALSSPMQASDLLALQRVVGNQSTQQFLTAAKQPRRKQGQPAPDDAARISREDVKYEIIAHRLAYQTEIPDDAKRLLKQWGYEGEWLGSVDDQATSFFVGLLVPNQAGKQAGRLPILAFRGTKELLDLVADTDPVAVGYEQFMANKQHVAQLIKTAGGKVDAVGHSLGGALAQHAAVTFASEINRLVTFQSPGVTASQAREFAKLKKRPSVTHHIAKGDLVDLAGVGHLEGEVYQHAPAGKNAIGAHTAQLLSASELKHHHTALGLNTAQDWNDMGVEQAARVINARPVERHNQYPHKLKGRLTESARTGVGVGLSGVRALISLGSATADLFREKNKDIHERAKQGTAGFKDLSAEKRSFMVYRLCQDRTGGTDETTILTILQASVANGDVAQVIQLAGPTAIYYALDGANYDRLRSIYKQHYYQQASLSELHALVNHCLKGLTERWEEMLADILVVRAGDSGRNVVKHVGLGQYNRGLRKILRVLDGKERGTVAAHYRYEAELRPTP